MIGVTEEENKNKLIGVENDKFENDDKLEILLKQLMIGLEWSFHKSL